MFYKKFLFCFLCYSNALPAMEIARLVTQKYRTESNNLKIVARDSDTLMHKLYALKKRKKSIKKIPPVITSVMEPEPCDWPTVELVAPLEYSSLILEDLPICIKQEEENPDIITQNQELLERYKRRKALGYKNYVARHFLKKGRLILRKNFPNF